MASPNQLPPQVGDTTNLLLKKLVTATQGLGGSGGVFLTEAEADALYFRLNGSNSAFTRTSATVVTVPDGFNLAGLGTMAFTPVTSLISSAPLNAFNIAAGLTPIAELEVASTSTATVRGIVARQFSGSTDSAKFMGQKARGTRALPTVITTGDFLTRWTGAGYDGTNFIESASIVFGSTGTIASTRVPSFIEFQTGTNAAPTVMTAAAKFDSDQGLKFPSTNTVGIQLYNTADQTTNYERLEAFWSANVATIRTAMGGSGTMRVLYLGNGFDVGTIRIRTGGSTSGTISFAGQNANTTAGSNSWRFDNYTHTGTSGTNIGLSLNTIYNQASGTAANTDLLINRTETALGSGVQYWEDRQVGSVSRMATGTGKVLTTNATVTTIQVFTIPASTTWAFDGYVVARRTGGAAGSAEDGASYRVEAVIKNVAGTATSIGSTVTVIGESQAAWDVTVDVTGATARIRVTGAADNNVSWVWTGNVRQISS